MIEVEVNTTLLEERFCDNRTQGKSPSKEEIPRELQIGEPNKDPFDSKTIQKVLIALRKIRKSPVEVAAICVTLDQDVLNESLVGKRGEYGNLN